MSNSKRLSMMGLAIAWLCAVSPARASPWDSSYFPNVPLVTHDGDVVHFFDDLIEDKIVSINFIYTSCVDTCPLETAQLVRVQQILGDRLGKDIFFYSITIDPDHDTAQVLKEYRDRFRANWTFLTGEESDIIELRRKLGLYVEEIQDGSNNHNVNMIIGNQATGRWMKRSPFENPYVLADQLGNWLTGWTSPPQGDDYANAPELRSISHGEQLFRTRCATCHSLDGHENADALGPDLLGVIEKRDAEWIMNWIMAPDRMLEQGDPIALALFAQYNNLPMPNMRLHQQEALDLIEYIDDESQRQAVNYANGDQDNNRFTVTNAWVRETDSAAKANAGYMTLINETPDAVKLIKIESTLFEQIEMHEMSMIDGLMSMREVADLDIPANSHARFLPGGWHLMMKGPRRRLTAGDTVDLKLIFDSGMQHSVSVEVATK